MLPLPEPSGGDIFGKMMGMVALEAFPVRG
jgi:hypothetical protein